MNHKKLFECTTYLKAGGDGKFDVNVIVQKDNNSYAPLKKW